MNLWFVLAGFIVCEVILDPSLLPWSEVSWFEPLNGHVRTMVSSWRLVIKNPEKFPSELGNPSLSLPAKFLSRTLVVFTWITPSCLWICTHFTQCKILRVFFVCLLFLFSFWFCFLVFFPQELYFYLPAVFNAFLFWGVRVNTFLSYDPHRLLSAPSCKSMWRFLSQ